MSSKHPRTPRTLVLSTSFPTPSDDAAGHFVATEAAQLVRAGHQVTVVAPNAKTVAGIDIHPLNVRNLAGTPGILARMKERPHRIVEIPPLLSAMRRAALTLACDRIIAHWLFPCALPVCRGVNKPLEVVLHGSDVHLACKLPGPWLRRLLVWQLPDRTQLRFVSSALRQAFVQHVGALPFPCRVQPSPIDVPTISRAEARGQLGLARDALIALVVGRLVPSKRVAKALVHPLLRRAQWFVIGEGPERDKLQRQHPHVCFTGHLPREQTLRYIAAADWLVHPSQREGAPSVIREARALGVRVLASPCGDIPQWAASDPGILVHQQWRT